ncbi:MAG: putative membrane protein [Kiritimatiellia bacterium]|jgi:putative membrane protein
MMTNSVKSNPFQLILWQQKNLSMFMWAGIAAWVLVEPLQMSMMELPVMPISIVGAAIGIFTSFRANQAYDRWWEGRKLWGKLINTSRHWCDQVHHYVEDKELAKELVDRQITYVHALRCLLRKQDPYKDADFLRLLREEDQALEGSTNLTHALLDRQMKALVAISNAGDLPGLRLQSMDVTLMDLLNIQGGCERIKGTPLPRGYGFIAELLVDLFAMMLPFALVHELGWVAIPLNGLVCLSLALIGEAGRVLEDPFSVFYNGLPLHALSIKIERNLRERRGDSVLPASILESPTGILM